MSIAPQTPTGLDDHGQPGDVCAVCGVAVDDEGGIEDTSGWRWFSDGQGGLLPLCPSCPVPSGISGSQ